MDISELIRLAREEEERRRRLGLDNYTINQISRQTEIVDMMEGIKRLNNIPNLPIRDLRTKINDLGIHSQIKDARETLLQSPIFDAVREANLSALKVTEGIIRNSAIDEIKRMSATMAKDWTNFKDLVSPQMQVDKFLNAHLAQIIQTSALAQSALANIEISKITGAFQLADDMRISFRDKFTDFATSYKDLFKSFEIPETSLFRLPPSISEMPTIEFFNGVDLLETTVEEVNHDEYEELRIIVREEIRQSTKDSVIIQLQEVNPDWIKMLEGARQAFNSTNPDKNRQCITSLRELFRDIMLYLSPDEQIKDWSNSMDDFANNRPTRKARLRYIARNINHGAFTKFVEKDIEAIIAAIDIFQAGTHVVNSKLTDAQMNALFFRAESTILFLFSIANYEE